MTLKEFERECGIIYDKLPSEISSKFQLFISEFIPEKLSNEQPFGYWIDMFPEAVTLCYEAFKKHGDFSVEHIERVIKHEVEHLLLTRYGIKHSEH